MGHLGGIGVRTGIMQLTQLHIPKQAAKNAPKVRPIEYLLRFMRAWEET